MSEDAIAETTSERIRVLPETELLDEMEVAKDLGYAERYGYKISQAAQELGKMGPVLAEWGDRIHRLATEVEEIVAFLNGRSYYEVSLHAPRVRAKSEQEAIRVLGEEAALTSWGPFLEFDEETERIPWTEEI